MTLRNNASPVYDKDRGFLIITWSGLLNGDSGDPFDISGWEFGSIEWQGTPGAGFAGQLQATIDPAGAPASWTSLTNFAATAVGFVQPPNVYPVYARFIRPLISAGDGTTSMIVRAMCALIK
jgi:hypothetical protein